MVAKKCIFKFETIGLFLRTHPLNSRSMDAGYLLTILEDEERVEVAGEREKRSFISPFLGNLIKL